MRALAAFALSILLLAHLQSTIAWSTAGHTAVAAVADSILAANCKECASRAREVLGGSSFEDVATWADDIRSQQDWKWTSSLHFVDTPDWACNFNYQQDCADNMCVVGALNNFTKTVMGGGDWSLYAMKFIVHFVGDIHQPMHVSFASDRGGNNIKGHFAGKNGNLHQVWDSTIIDKHIREDFQGSQKNYESFILGRITGEWSQDAKAWAACHSDGVCADAWASETGALVCTNGDKDAQGNVIPNNYNLGDDYYDMNKDVVDQQVAKAAVRLAALAEHIFAPSVELESNEYLASN